MTTTLAPRSARLAVRSARRVGVARTTHRASTEPPATSGLDVRDVAPELAPHREVVRRELAAYAARIRLGSLVREHGGPLLVLDTDRVTTQLLTLRRELPGVQLHFAMTALPHPAVIRAVDAFGASFSVGARSEIDLLEREGVAIGRCLHTHPVKTVADITGAYLRGIRTFVVDSPAEVAKFQELPDASVLVRLSFANPGTESDPSTRFGVEPDAAGALVADCLRAGLRVAGFTFHLGSRTMSAEPWADAIRRTLALMRKLEHAHGIRFDTLDLGGGLPVAADEPVPAIAEIARGIRAALADAPSRYRIIVEPGRFIAAPAVTLVTRVIGTADHVDGHWAHLDGLHCADQGAAEWTHALVFAASELDTRVAADETDARVTRRLRARRQEPVTLTWPTRSGVDIIARRLPLPPLAEGDLVVIPAMGAYTASAIVVASHM